MQALTKICSGWSYFISIKQMFCAKLAIKQANESFQASTLLDSKFILRGSMQSVGLSLNISEAAGQFSIFGPQTISQKGPMRSLTPVAN